MTPGTSGLVRDSAEQSGRERRTIPEQTHPAGRSGRATPVERFLLKKLLATIGRPPLRFVLWTGESIAASDAAEPAAIHIADRSALWRLLADPMFQFGELYAAGRVTVDGDLAELLVALYQHIEQAQHQTARLLRWTQLLHRTRGTSLRQARENIHHHYDLGNDFYRLWLDEQMLYTCAYFPTTACTLEQAQIAKMDHVCRKLLLAPGETVVEAGCGWGALALHMARHYGVRVRAMNISHEQILYARQRARREGLDDRVEFVEDDWRNIAGHYDVFVSVGMLEHAGRRNYRLLGETIDRALDGAGRGLIHTIGRNQPRPMDRWIERRIFPGAYPPPLSEMTDIFEPHDFSVLDVENLRRHYALTLRHWRERFEQSIDTVRQMYDETLVRTWRLYLAGSIAAFVNGNLQLFQVTFAKGDQARIPWTRDHLYDMHGPTATESAPRPR